MPVEDSVVTTSGASTGLPARFCEHCGKPIQRAKSERPAQYRERRYCSPSCSSKARLAAGWRFPLRPARREPPKECPCCHIMFRQRANETPRDFRRRTYCSQKCGVQGEWNRRRGLPTDGGKTRAANTHRKPVAEQTSDSDAIAQFIAEHGVTRCPTKFVLPSSAAISPAQAGARLKNLDATEHARRPGETRNHWYGRLGGTAAMLGSRPRKAVTP